MSLGKQEPNLSRKLQLSSQGLENQSFLLSNIVCKQLEEDMAPDLPVSGHVCA